MRKNPRLEKTQGLKDKWQISLSGKYLPPKSYECRRRQSPNGGLKNPNKLWYKWLKNPNKLFIKTSEFIFTQKACKRKMIQESKQIFREAPKSLSFWLNDESTQNSHFRKWTIMDRKWCNCWDLTGIIWNVRKWSWNTYLRRYGYSKWPEMIYDGSAMLMLEKWKNCHEKNQQMSAENYRSTIGKNPKKVQFMEVVPKIG